MANKIVTFGALQTLISKIKESLLTKADIEHEHTIEDVVELQSTLNTKAEKAELHSHENKTVLDNITSTKVTEWDSKSTFSGSYSDLTNKPTIPTKTSQLANDSDFATNATVTSGLAEKSDTTHTHSEYANQNAFSGVQVGSLYMEATEKEDTLILVGGSNIGLSMNTPNKTLTIEATINPVTTSSSGLMSPSDKSKLDGVESGANKTTVDSTLSSTSTNPLQNKVINTALNGKANATHEHTLAEISDLELTTDTDTDVIWGE